MSEEPKKSKWKYEQCIEYNSIYSSGCRSCHSHCYWYVCPVCGNTSYEKTDTCPQCNTDMKE